MYHTQLIQEPPVSPCGGRHTRFTKPTVDEIRAYCRERRNGIDADEFFDSNEATGWVVGKSCKPMKDWRATIRTWERVRAHESAGTRKKEAGCADRQAQPDLSGFRHIGGAA